MGLVDIHITILAVTAVAILYADHLGYQYFTGRRTVLDGTVTSRLHLTVLLGLMLMITTGVLLTIPYYEYWLTQPLFYVKLGFVLTLIMNSWAIGKLHPLTTVTPFKELPKNVQKTFLVSGALSFASWVGATILSFFFI
jgi:hypothetical protein